MAKFGNVRLGLVAGAAPYIFVVDIYSKHFTLVTVTNMNYVSFNWMYVFLLFQL